MSFQRLRSDRTNCQHGVVAPDQKEQPALAVGVLPAGVWTKELGDIPQCATQLRAQLRSIFYFMLPYSGEGQVSTVSRMNAPCWYLQTVSIMSVFWLQS